MQCLSRNNQRDTQTYLTGALSVLVARTLLTTYGASGDSSLHKPDLTCESPAVRWGPISPPRCSRPTWVLKTSQIKKYWMKRLKSRKQHSKLFQRKMFENECSYFQWSYCSFSLLVEVKVSCPRVLQELDWSITILTFSQRYYNARYSGCANE